MSDYWSPTEDRTMPAVVYGLYGLGFVTAGLTAIAGAVIAHANQGAAGPVAQSHYTFLIRTFWLGLAWMIAWAAVFVVAIPFSFILIGIPFLILAKIALCAGAVWYGVRLIVGAVHLSSDRPYPHPWTVLA
jgi:uncharacterized membrane protein